MRKATAAAHAHPAPGSYSEHHARSPVLTDRQRDCAPPARPIRLIRRAEPEERSSASRSPSLSMLLMSRPSHTDASTTTFTMPTLQTHTE